MESGWEVVYYLTNLKATRESLSGLRRGFFRAAHGFSRKPRDQNTIKHLYFSVSRGIGTKDIQILLNQHLTFCFAKSSLTIITLRFSLSLLLSVPVSMQLSPCCTFHSTTLFDVLVNWTLRSQPLNRLVFLSQGQVLSFICFLFHRIAPIILICYFRIMYLIMYLFRWS